MKKSIFALFAVMLFSVSSWAFEGPSGEDSGGQRCSAVPTDCQPMRGNFEPNQLPTPEQIDWDNHPLYKHGGQPPKNSK